MEVGIDQQQLITNSAKLWLKCTFPWGKESDSYDQPVSIILKVNPPYYVRLVELVPHPETLPTAMDMAFELMTEVGQAPVRLRKEIDGFALNRVQYAIIAECWRLVKVSPTRTAVNITSQDLL